MRLKELLSVIPENTMLHIREGVKDSFHRNYLFECLSNSTVLDHYLDRFIITVTPHYILNYEMLFIILAKESED